MTVFENSAFDEHEYVDFVHDAETGLRSIIAIHSTVLGPAGGGIRMFPYADSSEALRDVLRLSRAMTYKGALSGLPVGGGKSVILGDPRSEKTEALLEAFGRAVQALGGRYICAEDVGTTPGDMAVIHRSTRFVTGLPDASGDTSPLTALGIFSGIRAAVEERLGRQDLEGLRVGIQGVGHVGSSLVQHLVEAGAYVLVTDVDAEAIHRVVEEWDVEPVSTESILSLDLDVLSPCALGAVLDDISIPQIRATIVCGGANNQLAEDRHGLRLHDRDILYVPDYVVNAGGLISGVCGFMGIDEAEARKRVEGISETCGRVFAHARQEGIASSLAADALARQVIREHGQSTASASGGRAGEA